MPNEKINENCQSDLLSSNGFAETSASGFPFEASQGHQTQVHLVWALLDLTGLQSLPGDDQCPSPGKQNQKDGIFTMKWTYTAQC